MDLMVPEGGSFRSWDTVSRPAVKAQVLSRLRNPYLAGACHNRPAMPTRRHEASRAGRANRAASFPAPGVLVALVAAVALLVVACGSSGPTPVPSPAASPSAISSATPSPAPSSTSAPSATPIAGPSGSPAPTAPPDLAATCRAIEDWVIADRGLAAKQRRDPIVLDQAELRRRITAQFEAENPPAKVEDGEVALRALGLLNPGASLMQLYTDAMDAQVLGFYDLHTKELYVVARSGGIGPVEKWTVAHEFTHELQDQNFDVKGFGLDTIGTGDRSLARLSLIEGDATLASVRWLTANLTPDELAVFMQQSSDPAAAAALEKLPAILRETLLFPYQQGYLFVNELWLTGGWAAVNRVFARPPDSTEQVMHPEKYAAGEKPVTVAIGGAALAAKLGSGWRVADEDTLGEFQLSVWLRERAPTTADAGRAAAAAAGWGGDRYVLLRGPRGAYALIIRTIWDNAEDAEEFDTAVRAIVPKLPGTARLHASDANGPELDVSLASDPAILDRLGK